MRQGVIFDMDGVLVDSGPPHAASWRALAAKHGLHMSEEDFAETFGQTSRDIIHRFWGAGLSAEEIRRIDAEKEALYRESIRVAELGPGASCRQFRAAGKHRSRLGERRVVSVFRCRCNGIGCRARQTGS